MLQRRFTMIQTWDRKGMLQSLIDLSSLIYILARKHGRHCQLHLLLQVFPGREWYLNSFHTQAKPEPTRS